MAKDGFGYGTEITRSVDRDIPGLLKSGYEIEKRDGSMLEGVDLPDIQFKDNKWVVKLDRDNASKHVNFIENYLFSGSQNVPNMVYEIDGKQYKDKYTFFRGARLEEIDGDDSIGLQ